MKVKIFKSVIVLSLLFLLSVPVFARGNDTSALNSQKGKLQARENLTGIPTPHNALLRSCQAREASIKKRMAQLTRLATNMETKFSSISVRVQDYYTSSGKTLSNYDDLVADIQAKKDAVDSAIGTAKTNSDAFSCVSLDPKSQVNQFRLDMQAVKDALKEYRTSIKNLIVAVRSLHEEE